MHTNGQFSLTLYSYSHTHSLSLSPSPSPSAQVASLRPISNGQLLVRFSDTFLETGFRLAPPSADETGPHPFGGRCRGLGDVGVESI